MSGEDPRCFVKTIAYKIKGRQSVRDRQNERDRQNDRDRKKEKDEEDRMKEKMQRMCTQRSILHKNCKASAQQLSKAELNPPLLLQSLATMEGCKWTYK